MKSLEEITLFKAALDVDQNEQLAREMQDWDVTIADGIDDETSSIT